MRISSAARHNNGSWSVYGDSVPRRIAAACSLVRCDPISTVNIHYRTVLADDASYRKARGSSSDALHQRLMNGVTVENAGVHACAPFKPITIKGELMGSR